jgi:subtilisin-like proprotein convertase family protein
MEWIVRPALVATIGLGQILAPQIVPAPSPEQIPDRIRVEAPVGPGSVYSTGDIVTPLSDNTTTDSTLFVTGRGAITEISVRLRIAHPRPADLDIQLIAPDGTAVKLANNVGGMSADFGAGSANCSGLMTTLADDGTSSVLMGTGPFLGVYRPDARLSTLHGRGAQGSWTLRVADEVATQSGTLYCWQLVMRRTVISGDLYGNGRSDPAYWRPTTSSVVARQLESSNTNSFIYAPGTSATDIYAPADFNGDGAPDPAWFVPSTGEWKGFGGLFPPIVWGGAGDVPVPGDYNADGTDDVAIWRPSTGTWFVRNQFSWAWGGAGDIPVPADYNGDGTTDMAVWRPSTGAWYVYGGASVTWGGAGDIPVPADYDGDARTDFGIWRPATGEWFILTAAGTVMPVHTWGGNGDIPVPADYDNDLKAEVAVWRPSNATYYIRNMGSLQWGQASDTPGQKRPAYPGYPY